MSDEKLDKLENSINELANITGNLVKAVETLAAKQQSFDERLQKFDNRQKINSGRLEDVIRVVLEMKNNDEEFRRETNENFKKLRNESRVTNRKVEWTTNTSLDAQKRAEDLEIRVARIEEIIAA